MAFDEEQYRKDRPKVIALMGEIASLLNRINEFENYEVVVSPNQISTQECIISRRGRRWDVNS